MVESGGVGDFLLPAPAGTVLGRGAQLNVHAVLEFSIFAQKSLWTRQLTLCTTLMTLDFASQIIEFVIKLCIK